ncbi:mid1-interacting protein 1 [Rhodnius prolixus]|uniref:Putative ubiquitin-conjugating enzyme n=1 Tax=Rhodnius prolixus TaxID=13249 RepID=R4FQ18_RHOPR
MVVVVVEHVHFSDMLTHDFQSNSLFSDKFSANMDSNRHCVRRVVPHKEASFSSGSIMKAMERFVEAVQEMDETILVPSRLMDLEAGDTGDTAGLASSTDLYGLYTMVNCVKNELLWGVNMSCADNLDEEPPCCSLSEITIGPSSNTTSSVHHHKTHVRRPSTTSVTSTQSAALSDTDSDASSSSGNENDSGIDGETETTAMLTNKATYTRTVEATFRRHLYGLQRSLAQMTAAASYLTKRYQSDIGATV